MSTGADTPVPVIAGPTASGKSRLAMRLAEEFPTIEIVSADSRQIYRHLSIGTAKPSSAEQAAVPHHCIDLIDITERYSAGRFSVDASAAIDQILARNGIPLIVGGTGFYLRALFEGLAAPPLSPATSAELERRVARSGVDSVYRELLHVDPTSASAIPATNVERVIRALGCFLDTGRPYSSYAAEQEIDHRYRPAWVLLEPAVSVTWHRIEMRCDAMLRAGLVDEVRGLLDAGFSGEEPGFRTVGYRETVALIRGDISAEEHRRQIIVATRRYAKRQRTWFRHQVDEADRVEDLDDALEAVRRRLRRHYDEERGDGLS